MALNVSAPATHINGKVTTSPAEDEELYTELLRIRDAVIAGKHAHFRLPQAAIERLKASTQTRVHEPSKLSAAAADSAATRLSTSADASQSSYVTPPTPSFARLPGLKASTNGTASHPGAKPVSYSGLDPIFLEKSDSLVRAEGQLKRQRIERELQTQAEYRKQLVRDREPGVDAPSAIDIEAILALSAAHVKHVSGLRAVVKPSSPASSSFDENDYYSSQVQSEWSSDVSLGNGSDQVTGAFTADFERLEDTEAPPAALAPGRTVTAPRVAPAQSPEVQHQAPAFEIDDEYDPEEEMDDEYTPPAASAFAHVKGQVQGVSVQAATSEEDNSEYEPGEIAPAAAWPSEHRDDRPPAQDSPQVPVIRNHLTHIAAPQPNRVSPLAVAKRPSIELELVNGRPEVVQRLRQAVVDPTSRASTTSRSGNNAGSSNKRLSKKAKKRKRREEAEAQQRAKKKRTQESAPNPPTFTHAEPLIKDEPVSTPPLLASIQDVRQAYERPQVFPESRPVEINLLSPGQPSQGSYDTEPRRRSKRLEAMQSEATFGQAASSPGAFRQVPRDNQDLRRVASMQYARMPRSPAQLEHSPHRTASLAYGEYGAPQNSYVAGEPEAPRYREQPVQYVRVGRSPSPPRLHDYQELYARPAQSPAMMPPRAAAPRHIVVDQFGNRYYAAEAAPQPIARASVAPNERQPATEKDFERAPSRIQSAFAPRYEPAESRMAPPPSLSGRRFLDEERAYYPGPNGFSARDYGAVQVEPVRYVEQPPSPVYPQALRYETMPPPPAPMPPPARERTSPVYASRAYSVRPENATPLAHTYIPRQASVAPVQYVRQEMPPTNRAMSVMPGYESSAQAPFRAYGYAPQPTRYVDQHGQEVYPHEVRQVSEYRY